jgi:Flp pilus assembly protein TadB
VQSGDELASVAAPAAGEHSGLSWRESFLCGVAVAVSFHLFGIELAFVPAVTISVMVGFACGFVVGFVRRALERRTV